MIGGGGVPPQHRWSAQRWADGINLGSNAVLAFNHPLGQYTVCLGYSWIHINVAKKYLKNKKIGKKPMICGIHYFTTALKTKIDAIILSRFDITVTAVQSQKAVSDRSLCKASRYYYLLVVGPLRPTWSPSHSPPVGDWVSEWMSAQVSEGSSKVRSMYFPSFFSSWDVNLPPSGKENKMM